MKHIFQDIVPQNDLVHLSGGFYFCHGSIPLVVNFQSFAHFVNKRRRLQNFSFRFGGCGFRMPVFRREIHNSSCFRLSECACFGNAHTVFIGNLRGLCNGQQMHGILYRVSIPYAGFVRTFPMQQLLRNRWSVVVYQTKIGLAGL